MKARGEERAAGPTGRGVRAGVCGVAASLLAQIGCIPAHAQPPSGSPVIVRGSVTAGPASAATRATAAPAESSSPAEIAPAMALVVGKSTLLRLPSAIDRISVGNPVVADVTLISPRELYLLGKAFGTTNVIMWRRGGPTTIVDVTVNADVSGVEQQLRALLPEETGIRVLAATDSLVLSGVVSSAQRADYAVQIAESYVRTFARGIALPVIAGSATAAPGQAIQVAQSAVTAAAVGGVQPRVVNLMRVAQPQQVMLEVKVAEVSKNLLDKLGVGMDLQRRGGNVTYGIVSSLLSGSSGTVFGVNKNGNNLQIDADRKDGLVKILAEPNIVAISGQEASFLAGGKIFIPVARANAVTGGATITLEEKEFGVGLKFTPTVLDGGRINLKVAPEVSELSQTGSPFTTIDGTTAVLPSFTTRRAQTTVQLMEGQSLAIAGLIKNNVTETIKRIPLLGEVPILGALFRSSEFQTDRTELMFIITPRMVRPLPPDYPLPTDAFVPPSRGEFFLEGRLEGSGSPDVPADRGRTGSTGAAPAAPPAAPQGGYQIK